MTREEELLKGMERGDTCAVEELIALYYPDILRYCLWQAPNRSLAEDAVQETFLKAIRFFDTYTHKGKVKAFLIALFCVVIVAPVFASDYQTQADYILRCTKCGCNRLGLTKIISALTICTLSLGFCLLLYACISNSLFGWECMKTSIQMIASTSSLLPLDMGQLQGLVAMASVVSFIAAICATLFISAKCKTTVSALSISVLLLLLPIILCFAVPSAIEPLIRAMLPSGGIGLQNSYLYAMFDFKFINFGQFSIWTPYAMLAMAVIEIPLFFGFTLYAYTKHRI